MKKNTLRVVLIVLTYDTTSLYCLLRIENRVTLPSTMCSLEISLHCPRRHGIFAKIQFTHVSNLLVSTYALRANRQIAFPFPASPLPNHQAYPSPTTP